MPTSMAPSRGSLSAPGTRPAAPPATPPPPPPPAGPPPSAPHPSGTRRSGGLSPHPAPVNTPVNAVNHAPVLSGPNDLTNINEDDTASSGDLISSLIAGMISEVDAAPLSGVAVTDVDNSNGT